MSVQKLATSIKSAVDTRIANEAKALHGTVTNGMFVCGAKTYPFKQAIDCNISGGKLWAQLDKQGKAIIIGA